MYISVRVIPEARAEKIQVQKSGRLIVSVKEPAKQNQANRRVQMLLAKHFKLASAKVRLISGHHSPSKIFSIDNDPST